MHTETSSIANKDKNSINLGTVLKKYIYHWPLFVLGVSISVGIAYIYLKLTPPVYEISATILVKDEKKSPDEKPLLGELDKSGSSKNAETEIEILKSKRLMSKVVNELSLWTSLRVREGMKTYDLYDRKPFDFEFIEKGGGLKSHELDIFIKDKNTFEVRSRNGNNISSSFGEGLQSDFGKWKLLPGKFLERYTGETVTLRINDPEVVSNYYASAIDARLFNKTTPTIGLFINDEVPSRGKDILNALINAYNALSASEKERATQKAIDFINDRLASLTGEVSVAEGKVEGFSTANGLTNIGSQSQIYLQNVQTNDNKLNEVNVQLNVIEGIEKSLSQSSPYENASATVGVSDPALNSLIEKLSTLQLRRTSLLATIPESSPALEPINQQIAAAKKAIRQNIAGIKNSLLNTRRELQSLNNKFESSIKKIPEQERQYVSMKRQLAIKENLYVSLLQKREELSLSYASTLPDARIVDEASIGRITWPKIPFVLALALVGGVGFPFLLILFRRSIDRKIIEKEEIEDALGIKVLGELYLQDSNDLPISNKSNVINEQIRTLRTNLYYLHNNRKGNGRVHLITSSISSEGKSFVCSRLASSLASVGKKTIILEMDLRKPKIARLFNLTSEHAGISEFLSSDCSIKEIIRPSGIMANLDIIGCGHVPPNPSELLEKDRLHEMIDYLRSEYDDIFIDSPPLHLVTDAMIISRLADVTLYVIKQGHTGKAELDFINGIYASGKIKNMHIIFNGIRKGRYGYGYNYDNSYYAEEEAASLSLRIRSFLDRF